MPNATGYPDFQRVSNQDSVQIDNFASAVNVGSPITRGRFDVSRYAYVTGTLQPTNAAILVVFKWFIDSAAGAQIAQRGFVISPNIPTVAQFNVKNLGPFVSVQYIALAANAQIASFLFGSNRPDAREFVPTGTQLINGATLTVNANSTLTVWPSDYWAGPVRLYLVGLTSGFFADLHMTDTSGNDRNIDGVAFSAAGRLSVPMITPAGAWFILLTNSTAAQATIALAVTASMTGSS